jgi:hypothetical protein
MNTGLSESATIAILLLLIFGAVSFYLYSRVNYTEKRMSLMENMLLDIKMSLDSMHKEEPEYSPEPVGAPTPLQPEEGEALPEEENYYKEVLETAVEAPAPPTSHDAPASAEVAALSTVSVNYESMTKDELIALAEKRGIKLGKRPGRKDLISALRKGEEVNGPASGSDLFPMAAPLEENDGVVADSLE